MAEDIVILKDNGKVFCYPGVGDEKFTQFFPGGGLTPSGLWVPFNMDSAGKLIVSSQAGGGAPTADVYKVPASTSPVTIAAANPTRDGLYLVNNSNSVCYLAYSSTVDNDVFTEAMDPGSSFSMQTPIYSGIVTAVWVSANGQMQVTEY